MQDGAGENLSKKQEKQMISPLTSEIVEHADLAESKVLDETETLKNLPREERLERMREIYQQTTLEEKQTISPLTSEIVEHADLAKSSVLDKAETLMEMSDEKMTEQIFEIYQQTALQEKESE